MNQGPTEREGEPAEPLRYLSKLEAVAIETELLKDYRFGKQQLIEIWGHACAIAIVKAFPLSSLGKRQPTVLVVCGPGQNGCIGLVCARHLRIFEYAPTIFYPKRSSDSLNQDLMVQSALPKCIGPGCGKNALPDSVYCGNDCILRHAAAAMKSITDVKETKPKEKPKPKGQKKPTTRSTVKKRSAGRRSTESSGQPDDDDDSDSEDEEEDEEGERKEQEPAVASWSSDHNYNAVTPEKTAPNASSVFNKSSGKESDDEDDEDDDEEATTNRKQSPVSSTPPKPSKKVPASPGAKTLAKRKKHTSLSPGRGRASKKPALLYLPSPSRRRRRRPGTSPRSSGSRRAGRTRRPSLNPKLGKAKREHPSRRRPAS